MLFIQHAILTDCARIATEWTRGEALTRAAVRPHGDIRNKQATFGTRLY